MTCKLGKTSKSVTTRFAVPAQSNGKSPKYKRISVLRSPFRAKANCAVTVVARRSVAGIAAAPIA